MWYVYFDRCFGTLHKGRVRKNWFLSLLAKPKFSIGNIVSLRAGIPQESVLRTLPYRNQGNYVSVAYGHNLKGKPLMIIGEGLPESSGRRSVKTYTPNNNGGMRFYKVIPMGGTEAYYIVERSLKINRAKAIKDAKNNKSS